MIARFGMVCGLLLILLLAPNLRSQTNSGWHKELEPGLAEAKRTGKPIFLVFRCEP